MVLLLLLPILVAGYIVIIKHPVYFYKLHRYDGQLLYLSSAYQGFICTLLAAFIVFTLDKYIPSSLPIFQFNLPLDLHAWVLSLLEQVEYKKELSWFILVSITAMLVAVMRVVFFRLRAWIKYDVINLGKENKSKLSSKVLSEMALIRMILKDSPLDSLLYDSFVSRSPEKYLMLTMDDGKVYVGKIFSLGEPTESEGMDQEIAITPFLSGYRKEETMKVVFTTEYSEIEKEITLILKQEKIVSATIFDSKVYEEFQNKRLPNYSAKSGQRKKFHKMKRQRA